MSFVEVAADSHFPIQNLPYGVFSVDGSVRIFGVVVFYAWDVLCDVVLLLFIDRKVSLQGSLLKF